MKEIENTSFPVYPSDLLKKEANDEPIDVINDFVIPLINKREKDVKHKEELIKLVSSVPKKKTSFLTLLMSQKICVIIYI